MPILHRSPEIPSVAGCPVTRAEPGITEFTKLVVQLGGEEERFDAHERRHLCGSLTSAKGLPVEEPEHSQYKPRLTQVPQVSYVELEPRHQDEIRMKGVGVGVRVDVNLPPSSVEQSQAQNQTHSHSQRKLVALVERQTRLFQYTLRKETVKLEQVCPAGGRVVDDLSGRLEEV